MNANQTSIAQHPLRQYALITANYWVFTLTDGALRMLVVLHFHTLGYGALDIALLFLFYEFFGVITNLIGGWLGARIGLNKTMNIGLGLQVIALAMLLVPNVWLTIVWVMAAQALSGIAKDLNKMSAKSAIKQLSLHQRPGHNPLFKAVAILTGSKNTLKGIGFFMGAALLTLVGFKGAVASMTIGLAVTLALSLFLLQSNLGKSEHKPKFSEILSQDPALNALSAARLFLFAARDIWFVVALPVFLSEQLNWSAQSTGVFFALWIIAYGAVQAGTPVLFSQVISLQKIAQKSVLWMLVLGATPAIMALIGLQPQAAILFNNPFTTAQISSLELLVVFGLSIFGIVFAINSSVHSYLIVALARDKGTSMDVGFYYMANACGRLLGTVLSGLIYQVYNLEACLWASALSLLIASVFMLKVIKHAPAVP